MPALNTFRNFIKLLRLPFLTAGIIPYLIGAAYVRRVEGMGILTPRFFMGLLAVICAHLGANVLNDYFDSKSGCDWQDKRDHIFFGGSKVIQKGLLSEKTVLLAGMVFVSLSLLSVIALQFILKDIPVILFGVLILFLAIAYTAPPLKLAYRGIGEAVIFILFGAAIVCGSYTIAKGSLFGMDVVLLSLPVSFLVTAILYCNEVPDRGVDKAVGKNNIVVRIGPEKAFWGYALLVDCAFLSTIACVFLRVLPLKALFLLLLYPLYIKPAFIIKDHYGDLERLKEAARITILGHTLVGAGMIGVLVC